MMLRNIAILFGITMLPAFELRASIPVGILEGRLDLPFGLAIEGMGLPWPFVFVVCVVSNAVLGIILYPILDRFIHLLERIPLIGRFWEGFVAHAQRRIHPYVERWGAIGVALFVAVPLPGSGSYSGAVGAYVLGMSYRRFILANTLGVIIAGIAVTAIVLTGSSLMGVISSLWAA
jgi:uncharacterized membrane protein